MPNGYSPVNQALDASRAIAGVVTNQLLTREFAISANGSLNFVAKLVASGVTVVGAITAKLQTAIGNDWVDSKTASITVNGNVYIKIQAALAGDQTFLPLLSKGRIVLTTTNAGDQVTITEVDVLIDT